MLGLIFCVLVFIGLFLFAMIHTRMYLDSKEQSKRDGEEQPSCPFAEKGLPKPAGHPAKSVDSPIERKKEK